ncbi:hypothetical protein HRK08_04400 [Bordetella pertussis]|uniref:hypothetical protein n=1 Tax=Bordetella pertussis TaxID=520 RepID=UPI000A9A7FA6|nr:hypothetical protein [Bordetella pertussis]ULY17961.1 hypothetical protein HRK08_04400 [Bordetella pertussis]
MFTFIDPGETNEKDPTFRHGVAASGTRPAVSGLGPRRWLPERLAAWKMLPHGQKGRHGALPLSLDWQMPRPLIAWASAWTTKSP